MLIRETPTTDLSTLQAMTGRGHDAEMFIREDHTGSVVLGDDQISVSIRRSTF